VNFAVYSEHATAVDVCLFEGPDGPEVSTFRLPETTAHVFHGYVPGLAPGRHYGLRAHGPWDPDHGHRFNPKKLLVDPYARRIEGTLHHAPAVYGFVHEEPSDDRIRDDRDSAPFVPKSVVVHDDFDWGDDRPPRRLLADSVIYELHVKGFTARHPQVDAAIRGTFAGLASETAIAHLTSLGVTAVQLLPIHQAIDDAFLVKRGLRNYWGYQTLGYFAPDQRFAHGDPVASFKSMVKALHASNIEVFLDVVYNHTCEGNHVGPTLSLRGLDNRVYYWLQDNAPRLYTDFTGTGNSLDVRHPQTLKLVMDSLRYWVSEMHVDGFRFDLASTLGRGPGGFDRMSAFFAAVHQDPVLCQVKLIAEPWDVGVGGYQVGNFPVLWSEWNGRYRDAVRRYWAGTESRIAELGYRLTGSSDLYQLSGRRPYASVNFVTAHDGFTLHDLVSYEKKHNQANGENNRDGDDHNNAWNCGVEGETDDEAIVALRERQKRNMLATLFLAQGVPMLVAGDEMGRTQRGNNNAYCQDNDLSWVDWELDEKRRALLAFARKLISVRHSHPVLRRRRFFRGVHVRGSELKDLAWFRPDGVEMSGADWENPCRTVGLLLGGDGILCLDEVGRRVVGDTLLVLLNGEREPVSFRLPAVEWAQGWEVIVDTGDETPLVDTAEADMTEPLVHPTSAASTEIELASLSVVVLRSETPA